LVLLTILLSTFCLRETINPKRCWSMATSRVQAAFCHLERVLAEPSILKEGTIYLLVVVWSY
jgi:hypothetical protein